MLTAIEDNVSINFLIKMFKLLLVRRQLMVMALLGEKSGQIWCRNGLGLMCPSDVLGGCAVRIAAASSSGRQAGTYDS